MLNARFLLLGLVGLDYLLLLVLLVTGVLQLVQKESAVLRGIHRWTAIVTIAVCAIVHAGVILLNYPALFRLTSFVQFLALTFLAGVTGWAAKPGALRIVHVVFGAVTFLLFTVIIFRFVLGAA